MALPRTFIELLDLTNLSGTPRSDYETKIYSILLNTLEKGRKEGYKVGYEEGIDVCLDTIGEEDVEKT